MDISNYKHIVAASASISTIVQFLSGVLTCQVIVAKRSTGDYSCLPFLCGFLASGCWLIYGALIEDRSIILVNVIGATLHFAYVLVYCTFSVRKSYTVKELVACKVILLIVAVHAGHQENVELTVQQVGLFCCILTVLFCGAPLGSLLHVIRSKSTECLPFPIIVMTFATTGQWFLYGVILSDPFIQIPNLLGCLLSAFALTLFCIYPNSPKSEGYKSVYDY